MATYRTTDQAVYLSDVGLMVFVGQTFTTDAVPGSTWEPLDDAAKAACKARFPDKYPDEPVQRGKPKLSPTTGSED
jgi:hypothetical protein